MEPWCLTYECPTCHTKYEANILAGRVSYQIGNKLYTLESEKDDCAKCLDTLSQAQEETREKIRAKRPLNETI